MAARAWGTRHVGLKGIALILALGLYWAAAQSEHAQNTVDLVQVRVVNPPRNVMLPEDTRRQIMLPFVSFVIRGPRSIVTRAAKPDHWYVEVDLRRPEIADRIQDGTTIVPVRLDMVKSFLESSDLDRISIDPDSFSPSEIIVRTQLLTRTVPVNLRLEGTPAAGLVVAATATDPVEVTITGSRPTLDRIESVATAICDISGIQRTLEDVIPLQLPEGVSLLTGQPASVKFTVRVR